MLSEILKIIPQIDKSRLGKMMLDLSSRFDRVAKVFGKGFEKVMKGNIAFLSLGVLTQLLNPLEKVHDKIKNLLGQSSDVRDLADKFNTTPATLFRLQKVGEAVGLKPEQLSELMTKYADAIEKARDELNDPTKELSESTQAVQKFATEKDIGQSFFQFLQSLKARGESSEGQDLFLTDRDRRRVAAGETIGDDERESLRRRGLLRRLSAAEVRDRTEQAVFGDSTSGASRRFVDTDFAKAIRQLGLAEETSGNEDGVQVSVDSLQVTLDKLAKFEDARRTLSTQNEVKDLLLSGEEITPQIVIDMEASAERERQRERNDLANAESLQQAAKGIDEIKVAFAELSRVSIDVLGKLGTYVPAILEGINTLNATFRNSRMLKFFSGGKD